RGVRGCVPGRDERSSRTADPARVPPGCREQQGGRVMALLPYWQATPCPAWCSGGHSSEDHFEDRYHRIDADFCLVTLTAQDPIRFDHNDGRVLYAPAQMRIDVEQHYRETELRIMLGEENTPEVFYSLTPAEAETI